MANVVVNAVGDQCPIPVVKATKALKAMTEAGTVEVHVDNEIAVQNLTRLASSKGLKSFAEKKEEKLFIVKITLDKPLEENGAEEEASCEVFGLLKRPDEKWVTERAYDNPKFVEDLVRDIALRLMAEPRIAEWTVKSENFESIHNHSAYAEISGSND